MGPDEQVLNGGLTHAHIRAGIAGGLAALYYGYEAIPASWIDAIRKKERIGELCEKAAVLLPER